jgi:prophage antirepressor-like protein
MFYRIITDFFFYTPVPSCFFSLALFAISNPFFLTAGTKIGRASMENEIVIYQTQDGKAKIDVRLEKEIIWLTRESIAQLFNIDRSGVSKHIKKIFADSEVDQESNVQKMHIANSDKPVEFFSIDVILAVGYKTNSAAAIKFRKWATQTLKEYLLKGFAINEEKFIKQKEKFELLKNTVKLFERGLNNQIEDLEQAKNLSALLTDFAKGLELLDDFGHENLDKKGSNKQKAVENW